MESILFLTKFSITQSKSVLFIKQLTLYLIGRNLNFIKEEFRFFK